MTAQTLHSIHKYFKAFRVKMMRHPPRILDGADIRSFQDTGSHYHFMRIAVFALRKWLWIFGMQSVNSPFGV